MKACKARPAFHISMPVGMAMGDHSFRSNASSTPGTPLPHTPLPFDMAEFMQHATLKRSRDDDEESLTSCDGLADDSDEKWQFEELDVLHSILQNPLRPLATPFPPLTLPPPAALDELTHQITSISMNASPSRRRDGGGVKEWQHSYEATRAKLFEMALKESKGLTLGPGGQGWVRPRPNMKRVGSMDFLEDGEDQEEEDKKRAMTLSGCLQAKSRTGPLSFDEPPVLNSSPSITVPSMTFTPSSPVAKSPAPAAKRTRPSRPSYTRRPSLLQRGRSFTASDLASEDGQDILDDVASSSAPTAAEPMTPTKRLTRSQSTLFPSAAPLSLTKAFLAPKEPSTVDKAELCKPLELKPAPRKSSKVRRLALSLSPINPTPALPRTDGLSSPFEERAGLDF